MATTANLGLRYPAGSDAPNVPVDIRNLAQDVDLTLRRIALQLTRDADLTGLTTGDWGDIASYDNVAYDVGGVDHGGGILTAPVDGLYEWELTVGWPPTTVDHRRGLKVKVNGNDDEYSRGTTFWDYDDSVGAVALTSNGKIPLVGGDTVQAFIYQSTGSTMTVSPKAFSLVRVA